MNRRRFLETIGMATIPFIAGCIGGSGGDGSSETENTQGKNPTANTKEITTNRETTRGDIAETIPTSDRTTTPISSHTLSSSPGTAQAPTYSGTVVTERNEADILIENTTNKRQTITVTVTPLPNTLTPRPVSKAPYEPRDLSGQSTLLSETSKLSPGGDKVYLGRVKPPGNYQITVKVRNGPTGAFDWHQRTAVVRIDIKNSSVEFSSVP